MKNKKLWSGVIGTVGMFGGVAMLISSAYGAISTGKRFCFVIVGYLCVFLATVYFGKAITKGKKPEENHEERDSA